MSLLNYLNIPNLVIPSDFVYTNVFYKGKTISGYTSYTIDDHRILSQLHSVFPDFLMSSLEGIFIQEINHRFNQQVHVDPRFIAINYVIESGGDVETFFPEDNESYKVIPHTWHWLYTNRPHAVRNVSGVRRAITMSIKNKPSDECLDWLISNIDLAVS